MTTSLVSYRSPSADVPRLETKAWRDAVSARLKAGSRPVTLYGARSSSEILVTAVLQTEARSLDVLRTVVTAERGYHSLTSEFLALHAFERELHEQYGVRIGGHPWLKPIRFEHRDLAAMDAFPFYRIDGKEVHEVAVGPIHAGVIEPGAFRFMCLGEKVEHLEIHLGYQHRGVESLLLRGDPRRLAPLVETVAGDTSVAHTWAYSAAVEGLASVDIEVGVEAARGVALELERVAMHLTGLSGLSADVGFLQGASTYGRLRTTAINATMRLCGSRFGRGALRPGGTGMSLDARGLQDLRGSLELLKTDLALINDCFLSAVTVQHRLRGVGVLPEATARELGVVGMAARSSGIPLDQRSSSRGIYAALPVEARVETSGDCWARARLRISELDGSLAWLGQALDRFPSWTPRRASVGALAPSELSITVAEGWRGEVVHCIETDSSGGLAHYKVQDPSLRNWLGLAIAVRGDEISDFPICNKSFDLSYCGNDL